MDALGDPSALMGCWAKSRSPEHVRPPGIQSSMPLDAHWNRRHPLPCPWFFQPSWYVQYFLFSLCQEVNRVGGHALPKVTQQEMLKSCLDEVVAAYEKLVEDKQTKVGLEMGSVTNHNPPLAFHWPWAAEARLVCTHIQGRDDSTVQCRLRASSAMLPKGGLSTDVLELWPETS